MKCGSFVLWVSARRKGSGTPYESVKETVSWWGTRDLGIRRDPKAPSADELRERGYVECDGDIIASVRAVDEPDWGHTYAKLEVAYQCDKCGQEYFPELPSDNGLLPEELSAFVTKAIAEQGYLSTMAARKQRLEEHEAHYGAVALKDLPEHARAAALPGTVGKKRK